MTKKIAAPGAVLLLLTTAAVAQTSLSSHYDFITLDHPMSAPFPQSNFPLGINDKRQIAGYFIDTTSVFHGYVWQNGKFTTIDFPDAPQIPGGGTTAGGINNRGDIAGLYFGKDGYQHGYLRTRPAWCDADDDANCKPVFTTINVPGAAQTKLTFETGPGLGTAGVGLNDERAVVGLYATPGQFSNGFVFQNGAFKIIDNASAAHLPSLGTRLFSITDFGVIAGSYESTPMGGPIPVSHGFLFENGKYTPIDVPGSQTLFGTQASGVNLWKQVVGAYSTPMGTLSSFLWFEGTFFTVNYPGMPYNELHGINNRGDLTGGYATDPAGNNTHGYVAFPK